MQRCRDECLSLAPRVGVVRKTPTMVLSHGYLLGIDKLGQEYCPIPCFRCLGHIWPIPLRRRALAAF